MAIVGGRCSRGRSLMAAKKWRLPSHCGERTHKTWAGSAGGSPRQMATLEVAGTEASTSVVNRLEPPNVANPIRAFRSIRATVSLVIQSSILPSSNALNEAITGAKARRTTYHDGFATPPWGRILQLMPGQQSLYCHRSAPEQCGFLRR